MDESLPWFFVWFHRASDPSVRGRAYVHAASEDFAVIPGKNVFCRDHRCPVTDAVHERTERVPYGHEWVPGSGLIVKDFPSRALLDSFDTLGEQLIAATVRQADHPQMVLDAFEKALSSRWVFAGNAGMTANIRRAANVYADQVGLPRPYPDAGKDPPPSSVG